MKSKAYVNIRYCQQLKRSLCDLEQTNRNEENVLASIK